MILWFQGDIKDIKKHKAPPIESEDLGKIFPGIFTCIFGSRIHINKHLGLYTELSYTRYSFISMGINVRI